MILSKLTQEGDIMNGLVETMQQIVRKQTRIPENLTS